MLKYEKDFDGNFHAVDRQVNRNSCGPACVRMVIKIVNGIDVGEHYIQALIGQSEGYRSTLGIGGVVATARNFDQSGTWNVGHGLEAARPSIKYRYTANKLELEKSTRQKPAIGVIRWSNGALHYVVVNGPLATGGRYLVLDPYCGVQYVHIKESVPGWYNPINATNNQSYGQAKFVDHCWLVL